MSKAGVWITVIIIAIVIVGGYFLFLSPGTTTNTSSTNNNTNTNVPSPTAPQKAITILDFTFIPTVVTIDKGTTVTWTNQDTVAHTVTSDSGTELASDSLAKGQSYSHTFNTPGTYDYHCSTHLGMKGRIIVQ
jgi:plastocyanin